MEIQANKENGSDLYLLPKLECPNCGSSNMAVRYVSTNGMMQLWCLDCRKYHSITKAKNWSARVSSPLSHWADNVKSRDHYVCHICGKQSKDNEAHHIIPVKNLDNEHMTLKFKTSNGITLCQDCHKMVHLEIYDNYKKENNNGNIR